MPIQGIHRYNTMYMASFGHLDGFRCGEAQGDCQGADGDWGAHGDLTAAMLGEIALQTSLGFRSFPGRRSGR